MNETASSETVDPTQWRPGDGTLEGRGPVTRGSIGVGWKVATLVFGASTVVLAILLSGQLARPVVYQAPPAAVEDSSTPTPAPTAVISDVSQLVGTMGFAIIQNYTAETGWPTTVTVDDNGAASTPEGVVLGTVPKDYKLSYSLSDDKTAFTLRLEDANGESAEFGPAATQG